MTAKQAPYRIDLAEEIREHLRSVDPRHHREIFDTIDEQLRHQPSVRTTNRKPLARSGPWGGAAWELRFGPRNELRVYYVLDEAQRAVHVVAIGIKIRNRLSIGGQEVEL